MKRFSEAAGEVARVAQRGRRAPAPAEAPEGEQDSRGCHAYGCPLPGAISASTVGGGPWFCRHHFGVGGAAWADITTRLRQEQAHDGELVAATPSVPAAVKRIRDEISETRARRAAAGPAREPGEDDE